MFEKYNYQGTWAEALHIFVYVYLNIRKVSNLAISNYHEFELRDTDVQMYNRWIDEGTPGFEEVALWLKSNSSEIEQFKLQFGTIFKPKVEMWSDRSKTSYYKDKLQASFEFEGFLEDFFRKTYNIELGPYLTPEGQYYDGENALGIEIKNDTLINKYGNIYFEYAEKSKAANVEYVPSGILKNDKSTYFLIGDKHKFWVFRKKRLVEIYQEEKVLKEQGKPSARAIQFKVKPTSLGFVYPVKNAENEAISLDTLINEIKTNK